jgi:hypothetical protein
VSGLIVPGLVIGMIVLFDLLVVAFGADSRPDIDDTRFGILRV